MHKWTLFVWYFIYNFFISARFHHWQIKHFQFFEARLLCLRFRRFGAFAIFPGAFINHVIYMLDKQSNMTSFIFFAIPYSYENSCKPFSFQIKYLYFADIGENIKYLCNRQMAEMALLYMGVLLPRVTDSRNTAESG